MMYEYSSEPQTRIIFRDGEYGIAHALFMAATNNLLNALKTNSGITEATLAMNAACNTLQTICKHGSSVVAQFESFCALRSSRAAISVTVH